MATSGNGVPSGKESGLLLDRARRESQEGEFLLQPLSFFLDLNPRHILFLERLYFLKFPILKCSYSPGSLESTSRKSYSEF